MSTAVSLTVGLAAMCAIAAGAQRPQTKAAARPVSANAAPASRPPTKAGIRIPTAASACCSATTTGTRKQALDIPVGPNNQSSRAAADQGQPTHFEIGRQWGVFVVKVPKDFGTKTVTWTIVSNGETQVDSVHAEQGLSTSAPFKELGMGNQPPVLAFARAGRS